jgi:hypothetical protein
MNKVALEEISLTVILTKPIPILEREDARKDPKRVKKEKVRRLKKPKKPKKLQKVKTKQNQHKLNWNKIKRNFKKKTITIMNLHKCSR